MEAMGRRRRQHPSVHACQRLSLSAVRQKEATFRARFLDVLGALFLQPHAFQQSHVCESVQFDVPAVSCDAFASAALPYVLE